MSEINGDFEPNILMFACKWCSYSGLDLAGTSRMTYPPNVTVIRTMCSSRVDPSYVMHAFSIGVDGVILAMCHTGDCHYIDGNYNTIRRFKLYEKMLTQFGIDKRRFVLEGISASEAKKAKVVIERIIETIKALGPINLEYNEHSVLGPERFKDLWKPLNLMEVKP